MRKVNVAIEAVVLLPVRVKLDVLIRADDDAKIASVVRQFGLGKHSQNKAGIEDVSVVSAEFDGLLAKDGTLEAQVGEYLDGGKKITVLQANVTDSR